MDVIDLSNYTDRIIHETSVDFIKRIIQSSIHIMQYDNNLPLIAVKLYKNGQDYILPSTAVVKIRWRKKDGTIVYKAVLGTNETRDTVYFEVDQQMTYFDGKNTPILEVTVPVAGTEDTRMAGSGYLYFEIDRNPIQNGDIESQSEYPDLVEAVRRAEAAEATAVEAAESVSASAAQIETNRLDIVDLKDEVAGIEAGQNLADIVADLTALNSLDVTNLKNNDKVQVLVDSNHDDASTVYNLTKSGSSHTWTYIGKYGSNAYTKTEVDNKLALKANSSDVYLKTETYTKTETDSAIADVVEDLRDGTLVPKQSEKAHSAESLDTNLGIDDQTPFNNQTAGGDSDITTGIQNLKKLVGASVVTNQLLQPMTNSTWGAYNGTVTFSDYVATYTAQASDSYFGHSSIQVTSGHRYLVIGDIKLSSTPSGNVWLRAYLGASGQYADTYVDKTTTNWQRIATVMTMVGTQIYIRVRDNSTSNWVTIQVKNVMLIDLTKMFGSQVADFIHTKEQAIAGDGIVIFKSMFPNDYYAYNTGTFIHSQSAKLKMVDYNQANFDFSKFTNPVDYYVCPINLIKGQTYVLDASLIGTAISNVVVGIVPYGDRYSQFSNHFISIIMSNGSIRTKQTFTVNDIWTSPKLVVYASGETQFKQIFDNYNVWLYLKWDNSRTDYEPYQEHIYDLPNDTLRGVLKVVNNKIVADGDEEYPDGTKKTKYNIKTYSSSDVTEFSVTYENVKYYQIPKSTDYKNYGIWSVAVDAISTNFSLTPDSVLDSADNIGKIIVNMARDAFVIGFAVGTTLAQAQAAINGLEILYELATKTETTSTAFAENIYVDDFGTMEFLDENNTRIAGIQGNEIFYKANISGFAESLYSKADGDPNEIMLKSDNVVPSAPTTNGTYTLKDIVSNNNPTYQWVLDPNDEVRVIKITSQSITLGEIATQLNTINTDGDHVLFDVSALGASMYLCTIFIDTNNNVYRIFDMVVNRIASGVYDSSKLLTLAIANADQVATQSQIDSLQTQIDELGGSKVIENWDALGDLIESGDSPNHISPGDTIDVNWINTVTGTITGTPTVTCNDKDKFISQIGEAEEATYLFVYNGSAWTYKETAITLSDWGLTVSGTPSTGAVMTINTTVKKVNYTFVGYDDMTVTGTATHNWVLEQTYAPDTKAYDSLEALFVVEAGTTIPAGSYKITQKYNDDSATTYTLYFTFASAFTAVNKTQFAATGINWSSPYVPTNVAGYTYGTTTVVQSAISVSQTEISGATDISTLTGVSIHNRLIQTDLGNNNWERSNIRAWLNDDTNGTGYSPSYDFDRPSSYNLSTGFLYGIDPRVKKLIQTTVNKFQAGYGNVGYTQGQTYECNDKVFLLSMKEMGFNINTTEGNLTDLYNDYITAAGYSGLTNDAVATRSKYNQAGGSKNNYRWSRSANTWGAHISRTVISSGSADHSRAIYGLYFAPAFTIGKKTS